MMVMISKIVKPAYAPFINLLEYLKALVLLSMVLFRILFAKMYVKPIRNDDEIFSAKNATMFVLTMPVMKGFNSAAPKYVTPITVVKQSIEPNKIMKRLGSTSDFNLYMKPSPSPLLLLPLKRISVLGLKNQIAKLDIFQKTDSKKLSSTSPNC